ncbi:hypothetical protein KFE98_13955 [bacterium SCSIO 12741]|nr:hypothetical protein KFE98_13955 [bacterium SCSIO 12741]
MKRAAQVFGIIIWLLLSSWCEAQNHSIPSNYLGMKEGLSFRHVTCLTQDHQGIMWIGTRDGLNRFDGYQFTPYLEEPEGLLNSYIHDLECDTSGILWIANEGGLNLLDPQTGEFQSFSAAEVFPGLDDVIGVYEITPTAYSRTIFLQSRTRPDQEFLYDYAIYRGGGKFERFLVTDDQNDTTYRYLANVFEDRQRRIWIRPTNTLEFLQVNDQGKVIDRIQIPDVVADFRLADALPGKTEEAYQVHGPYRRNQEFIQDTSVQDFVLNGCFCESESTVMFECNLSQQVYTKRTQPRLLGKHMPVNQIYDHRGSLWYQQGSWVKIERTSGTDSLKIDQLEEGTNVTTYFYESRDRTMWMGTNFGLFRLLDDPSPFQLSFVGKLNRNGFGNSIRSLEEGSSGELYAGLVHQGIYVLDHTGKESQLLPYSYFSSGKIYQILPYGMHQRDSLLWISNWFDPGILVYNLSSGEMDHLIPSGNSTGYGSCLLPLKDGRILQGTDRGINEISPGEQSIRSLPFSDSVINLSTLHITALCQDPNEIIWVGTNQSGLMAINPPSGQKRMWNKNSGLSSNSIRCVLSWNGFLWIGSPTGMHRLDPESGEIQHYTTRNGLPNNQVHAIQAQDDHLWISTNQGLSRFNPEEESFKNFTTLQGLPHNEFNYRAFTAGSKGLFFGGMNGVVHLSKSKNESTRNNFPVVLSGFEKFDGDKGQIKSISPQMGEMLHLYPGDKFFTFRFASTDYFSADNNRYAYRLKGLDNEWTPLGPDHQVRFNRLPPGNYQFEVKTQGRDGFWSQAEISLPLKVHQIFYKTWWFISLVILSSLAIVYGVYRYRINQFQKLDRLRLKIASDLHDDVGSLLTRISLKTDLIGEGIYNEEETQKEMDSIKTTSRHAVKSMRDIVWSIDSRKDRAEDLTDRMKDFAAEMLGPLDIQFHFDESQLRSQQRLSLEFRHNCYLLFKEAIHNIAKHSNATEVHISISQEKGQFKLVVQDNGSAAEPTKSDGQGLSNMKMRAKQLSGQLSITTDAGYRLELTARL